MEEIHIYRCRVCKAQVNKSDTKCPACYQPFSFQAINDDNSPPISYNNSMFTKIDKKTFEKIIKKD